MTADALHARFVEHAPALATSAAERALADAKCSGAASVDTLLISTCTGYLCPGLSNYVSQRLWMRADAVLLDLVGHGCGAAIPNWRVAESLLRSGRCERVLSVWVELCSAAIYLDGDPGVLVSTCLFGDGAGAMLLTPTKPEHPERNRAVSFKAMASTTIPAHRDLLRFEQRNGMLRNILTRQVPCVPAGLHLPADSFPAADFSRHARTRLKPNFFRVSRKTTFQKCAFTRNSRPCR
jgi:polyketide synthase Type III